MINQMYEIAKAKYAKLGIDTDAVIERMKKVPISIQCWQGDDVKGFEEYMARFTAGLNMQKAAIRSISKR